MADLSTQLTMLDAASDAFFEPIERVGEYTGDRLAARRPDTYRAVTVLLGQGLGILRIAALLKVSPSSVMAVREREGITLEQIKSALASQAHAGAFLAGDGIQTVLSELLSDPNKRKALSAKDVRDLAVIFGTLIDKGQLLSGQPTARVEIAELTAPEHDDFNAYVRDLRNVTPITATTDSSETHLAPKTPATKETADPSGAQIAPDPHAKSQTNAPHLQPHGHLLSDHNTLTIND